MVTFPYNSLGHHVLRGMFHAHTTGNSRLAPEIGTENHWR